MIYVVYLVNLHGKYTWPRACFVYMVTDEAIAENKFVFYFCVSLKVIQVQWLCV